MTLLSSTAATWRQLFRLERMVLAGKQHRVFKLEVDGKIHRAPQKWLIGGTIPPSKIQLMAHKYWKGDDSGNIEDEILFKGTVEILEELM